MSNSQKQNLGILIGIVFVVVIMAAKFLVGNMIVQFLKGFLSMG